MDGVTDRTDGARLTGDEALLQAAKDDWRLSEQAFAEQRGKELEDLAFESGEHWTEADLAFRKEQHKPAFVMDQISQQVAKVTNQPVHRIVVTPNGGGADPKSAEYWQGICRRVENLSGAEAVYKWARMHAIKMGRGFWRVRADYFGQTAMRPDGKYDLSAFEQDLRIEPILYQHNVHPDPRCRMLDYSDQRFCILTEDLHWPEFERLYPQATHTSHASLLSSTFETVAAGLPTWATEKTIRVAERYYVTDERVTLCVVEYTAARDLRQHVVRNVIRADEKKDYPTATVLKEHTFHVPTVKWMKYTAAEVLETADVPGRFIPVVMITGERRMIEGQQDFRGMVRMAKGPQRLVDFMESRLAEIVDLAAYDSWVVAVESTQGFEEIWDTAHQDRPSRLPWNKGAAGDPNPRPEHVTVAPAVQGIALASQRASMALRHVLGVPDVTPDELKPEQSGRAIRARQQEQEQTTSHYAESTASGIRLTGRIILSMGREIYDVPRILRINGVDEQPMELVAYSGPGQQPQAAAMAHQGQPQDGQAPQGQQGPQAQMAHMLDVSAGDFDVSVSAGRGYGSARQETVEQVTALVQAFPPMAPKAIPVILKHSDFPGALELASKMDPGEDSGMVPRAQAEQAQQVIDQLTATITELRQQAERQQAALQQKAHAAQQEQATRLQIEQAKLQAEIAIAQAKLEAEMTMQRMQIHADREKARLAAEAATAQAARAEDQR